MTSASHAEGRQFDPGQVYLPRLRGASVSARKGADQFRPSASALCLLQLCGGVADTQARANAHFSCLRVQSRCGVRVAGIARSSPPPCTFAWAWACVVSGCMFELLRGSWYLVGPRSLGEVACVLLPRAPTCGVQPSSACAVVSASARACAGGVAIGARPIAI